MSGLSFSPEHRLTERADYLRCYERGRRYFSAGFVLFAAPRGGMDLPWRLGMAVTRKTGCAVRRNRVRRLIRECFRLEQHRIAPGHDYVVVPKRGMNPRKLELASLRGELLPLLRAVVQKKPRPE